MRDTALIVDDVELNRDLLSDILEDNFRIVFAEDGNQALAQIDAEYDRLAVILLDLIMPEIDGFEVLNALNKKGITKQIPVLIVSGESTAEAEERCFRDGAIDFVHKPFNPRLVMHRVANASELFTSKMHLESVVEDQTRELVEKNARLLALNEDIIELLGNVVEARNRESGQHVKRVKLYSNIIARDFVEHFPEYGLQEHDVDIITSAAALHDVGKIMIEDAILLKPGRLTDEERARMQQHTTLGTELLAYADGIWDLDYQQACEEICHYHHERYDGRGYPEHLVGDEIPISAQIVALADVWDALVNERAYKAAIPCERAFAMIVNGECGVFSPKILEAFHRCKEQFIAASDQAS